MDIKRKQVASLVINHRSYPIYKGLNRIGRDKTATVIVKDLSVSSNHAIITVLDEHHHFISEVQSTNGTFLEGQKLTSLLLYDLKEGSKIKFANVLAQYKMNDLLEKTCRLVESQSNESIFTANTQISRSFSQSVENSSLSRTQTEDGFAIPNIPPMKHTLGIETQFEDEDVHEMETQIVPLEQEPTQDSLDVHEMETQIVPLEQESTQLSLNVHEMETQIEPFEEESTQNGVDIHEILTPIDIKKLAEKETSVLHHSDKEANVQQSNKDASINVESIPSEVELRTLMDDDFDIVSHAGPSESRMPVEIKRNENEYDLILDTDENSTDFFEFKPLSPSQNADGVPKLSSVQKSGDKSLEITDDQKAEATIENNHDITKNNEIEDSNDTQVDELELKARGIIIDNENADMNTKNDESCPYKAEGNLYLKDDKLKIKSTGFNVDNQNAEKKTKIVSETHQSPFDNKAELELQLVLPIQDVNSKSEDSDNTDIDESELQKYGRTIHDVIGDASQIVVSSKKPKPIDDSDTFVTSDSPVVRPVKKKILPLEDTEDNMMDSTELQTNDQADISNKIDKPISDDDEDEDFIPDTQDAFAAHFNLKTEGSQSQSCNSNTETTKDNHDKSDLFADETLEESMKLHVSEHGDSMVQTLSESFAVSTLKNNKSEEIVGLIEKSASSDLTIEKYENKGYTGKNEGASKIQPVNKINSILENQNTNYKEQIESNSIYLAPTQKLDCENLPKPSSPINSETQDIFLQPTQDLMNTPSKNKIQNKDLDIGPTQKLENMFNDENDTLFLQPTQAFVTPNKIRTSRKLKISSNLKPLHNDSEVFDIPTQAIVVDDAIVNEKTPFKLKTDEELFIQETPIIVSKLKTKEHDSIFLEATQKVNSNVAESKTQEESQLEVLFSCETPKVVSYTNRPSNPLLNILESSTSGSNSSNQQFEMNTKNSLNQLDQTETIELINEFLQSGNTKSKSVPKKLFEDENRGILPCGKSRRNTDEIINDLQSPNTSKLNISNELLDDDLGTQIKAKCKKADPLDENYQENFSRATVVQTSAQESESITDITNRRHKTGDENEQSSKENIMDKTENVCRELSKRIRKPPTKLIESDVLKTNNSRQSKRSLRITDAATSSKDKHGNESSLKTADQTRSSKRNNISLRKSSLSSAEETVLESGQKLIKSNYETVKESENKSEIKVKIDDNLLLEVAPLEITNEEVKTNRSKRNIIQSNESGRLTRRKKPSVVDTGNEEVTHEITKKNTVTEKEELMSERVTTGSVSSTEINKEAKTRSKNENLSKKSVRLSRKRKTVDMGTNNEDVSNGMAKQVETDSEDQTIPRTVKDKTDEKSKFIDLDSASSITMDEVISRSRNNDNQLKQSERLSRKRKPLEVSNEKDDEIEKVKVDITKKRIRKDKIEEQKTPQIVDNVIDSLSSLDNKVVFSLRRGKLSVKKDATEDTSEDDFPEIARNVKETRLRRRRISNDSPCEESTNETIKTLPIKEENSDTNSESHFDLPKTRNRRNIKRNEQESDIKELDLYNKKRKVPSKNQMDSSVGKANNSLVNTPKCSGLISHLSNGLNESNLSTPERAKRKFKPKIVFTMLDSPELEMIIKSLGGQIVDNIDAATVLVTANVKRSQKLLAAVGQGKPVCPPAWLDESKKASCFLDPWDFILEDKEAEDRWNFSLKESLTRSQNTKLFAGYSVQILVANAGDVLKSAVECSGGKVVSRAPAKSSDTKFVVVGSPNERSKYSKYLTQKSPIMVVAPEAIFDGVLRQELHLHKHLLK